MQLYPDNLEEMLDFGFIRKSLLNKAWCEEGKQFIEKQGFLSSEAELEIELSRVQEMRQILDSGTVFSTMPFVSLEDVLKVLEVKANILNEDQLVRLYLLIKGSHELLKFFQKKERVTLYPQIVALLKSVNVEKTWYESIDKILDLDEVKIKGNASEDLAKIRTKLNKLSREIDKKFNQVLKQYATMGFLADQKESFRSGRRVLAVMAENKRKVQGITLDISGNGTLVFIEPAEMLPLESELSEWQLKETREITRILRATTQMLYPFRENFELLRQMIGWLDALQAKARLASEQNAIKPIVSPSVIELKQARHPVLQKHLHSLGKTIVPADIKLTSANRILVISGPNAGGKSVAMKTLGILQLMAMFGLHLPAEEGSSILFFDHFFCDIGDDQSIEDDLSTYSSHLLKMAYFTGHTDGKTLFLIDEMGSGTDPAFGGPIAEAILEHLADSQSYGVVTTHYSNLKDFAANKKGVQNGAMSFNTDKLMPTYELHIGQAGASYAIEVAERSGLPADIMAAAKEKLGGDKQVMEQSLSEIQTEKQFLKGIRRNSQKRSTYLEKLVTDYESLKSDLEKNKKKLVKQYEEKLLKDYNEANRDLENFIRESKSSVRTPQDLKNIKETRKKLDVDRRKLADKVHKTKLTVVQENKEPIVVGSMVKLEDSPRTGVVTEIRKNKASVNFGQLTTTVPIGQLVHCITEEATKKKPATSASSSSPSIAEKSAFDLELDIRGKYKDEAISALEQFLDRAVMFGVDRLRIIHGKGGGVLRQTVQNFLKNYPFVNSYKHEDMRQGGDGVTIVELG